MLKKIYKDCSRCAHLARPPLGDYVEPFAAFEFKIGFAPLTVREHLRVVGRFNQWLSRQNLDVGDIDECLVGKFLGRKNHLRDSRIKETPPTQWLLSFLREVDAISPLEPKPPDELSASEQILRQFADYLLFSRGLAETTTQRCVSIVRFFLQDRCLSDLESFDTVNASNVSSFIVEQSRQRGQRYALDSANALRALFRWLKIQGRISNNLEDAVPSVASWRLRSVPTILTPQQVRRILRSCDRRTRMGRRNYAILVLLARLGLRAGEVVRMRLDDIDWKRGELLVRRKNDRRDLLPLPSDVGEALVGYLRHGRSDYTERRVFLCERAPRCALGNSSTVSSIVAAAFRRAGLKTQRRGAHVLRHSLATSLLHGGATMTEIGSLLGHQSLAATEVYTKVDLDALKVVVQPWPGGHR